MLGIRPEAVATLIHSLRAVPGTLDGIAADIEAATRLSGLDPVGIGLVSEMQRSCWQLARGLQAVHDDLIGFTLPLRSDNRLQGVAHDDLRSLDRALAAIRHGDPKARPAAWSAFLDESADAVGRLGDTLELVWLADHGADEFFEGQTRRLSDVIISGAMGPAFGPTGDADLDWLLARHTEIREGIMLDRIANADPDVPNDWVVPTATYAGAVAAWASAQDASREESEQAIGHLLAPLDDATAKRLGETAYEHDVEAGTLRRVEEAARREFVDVLATAPTGSSAAGIQVAVMDRVTGIMAAADGDTTAAGVGLAMLGMSARTDGDQLLLDPEAMAELASVTAGQRLMDDASTEEFVDFATGLADAAATGAPGSPPLRVLAGLGHIANTALVLDALDDGNFEMVVEMGLDTLAAQGFKFAATRLLPAAANPLLALFTVALAMTSFLGRKEDEEPHRAGCPDARRNGGKTRYMGQHGIAVRSSNC